MDQFYTEKKDNVRFVQDDMFSTEPTSVALVPYKTPYNYDEKIVPPVIINKNDVAQQNYQYDKFVKYIKTLEPHNFWVTLDATFSLGYWAGIRKKPTVIVAGCPNIAFLPRFYRVTAKIFLSVPLEDILREEKFDYGNPIKINYVKIQNNQNPSQVILKEFESPIILRETPRKEMSEDEVGWVSTWFELEWNQLIGFTYLKK